MRWRGFGPVVAVFLIYVSVVYCIETNNHTPAFSSEFQPVIHHPSASLSIVGDLKDLKLKSSIAQLVRALQTPSHPKDAERKIKLELETKKPELITKHTVTNVHAAAKDGNGRKLFYGEPVPDPITVSSQAIKISGVNQTGGKRGRSIVTVGTDGVKTIEGIRVPDDEHDKHYTWRNARVIKGFLVPNDRTPNPHKKRQVLVTDPQQYLAAAAAAQASGAASIIDGSGLQHSTGRQGGQPAYSHLYNQQQQLSQSSQLYGSTVQQQHMQQKDLSNTGSSTYNLAAANTQQQPVQQYQSTIGGQTTAFSYAPQQQGQMYVLQDGNTYLQYNPVQVNQPQQPSQVAHSQTQFYSRSGELQSSGAQVQNPPNPSSVNGDRKGQQDAQQLQIQQQIAQAQAAIHATNAQHTVSQIPSQNQQIQSQDQSQSASAPVSDLIQQVQQGQQDALYSAINGGAQYIQIQSQPQEQGGASVYHIASPQATNSQGGYQSSQNGQFVIQPQTYVTGPGGQVFTVPIPVPADQAQTAQRRDDHFQHQVHYSSQKHQQHQYQGKNPNNRDKSNLANRVMQALQNNKQAFERMDSTTTAVVPALASTGIFLGLSALAAGWYLSRANREVGIVRRTGKPAGGLSRTRRDVPMMMPTVAGGGNYPQEVDQATFFQSIIQQSLEKTQQQYDDQVEPVYNPNNNQGVQQQYQEPVYNREPEPERYNSGGNGGGAPRPTYSRKERPRPQSRNDDEYYAENKVSKPPHAQDKSGALTIGSSKNFAKVFIPALILGLSVISITALIFGWYITGANREIAFLEPASYSRRKRSLLSPTALSDGWLQRTITAIHGNPYDRMPFPTTKSLLPHPFMDRETSKTSDIEFKVSNAGLTGVLAGGAIIAIVALGLANSLSEAGSRQIKTGRANPSSSFSVSNQNTLKHLRSPRHFQHANDLTESHPDNPGFLAAVLSNIDVTKNSIVSKLQDAGLWQQDTENPCAKRIFCDVMSTQDDDTVQVMEKRMATFINMLPDTMAKSLRVAWSDVVSAISRKDCSSFTCGSHNVDSSNVHQPSSPVTHPR